MYLSNDVKCSLIFLGIKLSKFMKDSKVRHKSNASKLRIFRISVNCKLRFD